MALQAESTVRDNVVFNTPRSCMTINDGALGGDEVYGNLMLNCNRETSDVRFETHLTTLSAPPVLAVCLNSARRSSLI